VPEKPEVVDHYGAHYRAFAADVYAEVRREAFGDDVGQNSWVTRDELERFEGWLELGPSARLLDVACGSGGPALHLARRTACQVVGVEVEEHAVASGTRQAREAGLESRVSFRRVDASQRLPFEDGSFDAILCIDAICHLSDRVGVLADWARVLRPGGRLVFSEPAEVTGALGSDEIAIRTSVGYYLFVPPGEDERLLREAGLRVVLVEDTTTSQAEVAQRRGSARAHHEQALREIEGDEAFDGRQHFFEVAATLARERRLSRVVYVAERD
jgi:SAM-dependent methyltransferase